MYRLAVRILAVLLAPAAFAQLDSNTIAVTASRTIFVPPDQVNILVDVNTGLSTTLDQVLAALQPAGITAADFASTSTTLPSGPLADLPGGIDWSFATQVPFTGMKEAIQRLSALQKTLASGTSGMALNFTVNGAQTSAQAVAAQSCRKVDLIADARAQALKLATAAGFGLGGVVAASDSGAPAAAYTIASFGVATFSVFQPSPGPTACSISVKFRLLQN